MLKKVVLAKLTPFSKVEIFKVQKLIKQKKVAYPSRSKIEYLQRTLNRLQSNLFLNQIAFAKNITLVLHTYRVACWWVSFLIRIVFLHLTEIFH